MKRSETRYDSEVHVLIRTLKEVGLQVDVEDIAAQTLDRIVEWQDVYALAILDVKTLVYVHEIGKLDTQVVSGDFVNLDTALLHIIGTQADENRVSPLLASAFS